MTDLYNYKLWNPNLNQFVAQPDKRTVDHIHAMGGVVILDGGHPMSTARRPPEELPAPIESFAGALSGAEVH